MRSTRARTYEIAIGPKDKEHTRVEFTPAKKVENAWVYSEQLDEWVKVYTGEYLHRLETNEQIQKAMSEHLYQIENDSDLRGGANA